MAVYYIKGNIGENQFITFLITGSQQIYKDIRTSGNNTYVEAAENFDSLLLDNGIYFPWESFVFPIPSNVYNGNDILNQHLPGLYSAEVNVGDLITYDGELISSISKSSNSGYYNSTSSNLFPIIRCDFQKKASNADARYEPYVLFGPDDCVVDGKFNTKGKKIGASRLMIGQSDAASKYYIVLDAPDYDTIDNSLLDGKKANIFSDDPFDPGGSSGDGGGGGDFDNTSTPIEIPVLPSISAASTGFISLFNPSLSQLNELASYLWSDLFEIDGWKKLFANPMDAILGLSILPVAIPSSEIREVKIGNIGTGISLTVAASQFVEVDCGSIDVNEYWGAYLDYEPYTQAQIFLPYIGTRPISVDEIMGKTVRVVYHVDILTGACCCFVKCGDSVLYTYNGQCSIPIPITSANYASVVNGVISIAASVGSLVATGGASAPTAIPAIASSAVNQMKPQIEKSGSISGSAGVLNMQTPYIILIRPRQALPRDQNSFIGYPSLITVQLTELSGYTEVQSIHLENIPATQEELAEIQSLLEGGVIF